jgi:hypothetical protein
MIDDVLMFPSQLLPVEALRRPLEFTLVVSVLLVGFWAWGNKKWVHQAAERYAFALLETLDMPRDQ